MPIKRKQLHYNFTNEMLLWAKRIKRAKEIGEDQIPMLEKCYRVIDRKYEVSCSKCGPVLATEFKRLVGIMEKCLGVENIIHWVPDPEEVATENAKNIEESIPEEAQGMTEEKAEAFVMDYLADVEITIERAEELNEIIFSIGHKDWRFKELYQIAKPRMDTKGELDTMVPPYSKKDFKNKTKEEVAEIVKEKTGQEITTSRKRLREVVKEALEILNFSND